MNLKIVDKGVERVVSLSFNFTMITKFHVKSLWPNYENLNLYNFKFPN